MIKRFINYIYSHRKAALLTCIVLLVLSAFLSYFSPHTFQTNLRSVCRIDSKSIYVVTLKGGKRIPLSVESHQFTEVDAKKPDSASFSCSGFFVSNDGHVVTTMNAIGNARLSLPKDSLKNILIREKARLGEQQKSIDQDVQELNYYSKTHSVIDDGYNEIMEYREKILTRKRYIDSLSSLLSDVHIEDITDCRLETDFTVSLPNPPKGVGDTVSVYRMKASLSSNESGLLLLQTLGGIMPASAKVISPYPIPMFTKSKAVAGFWEDSNFPDVMSLNNMPNGVSPYINGAICLNEFGQPCGVYRNGSVTGMSKLIDLIGKCKPLPLWVVNNFYRGIIRFFPLKNKIIPQKILDSKGKYGANIKGASSISNLYVSKRVKGGLYLGRIVNGLPDGYGKMEYDLNGLQYVGHWSKGVRAGAGLLTDTTGRILSGIWVDDTISSGTITNTEGRYEGSFSASMLPEGLGSYTSLKKHLYYYGNWHIGKRDGYGYEIGGKKIVRSGIWRKDRFRGEQLVYTKDRVYGIDISRYQHEIGRRKYPIAWGNLRIKSLGTSSRKRVLGMVDYRVSFVYIKASQGTRIRNRYYPSDIQSARRYGYHVGAYHFLSTKASGRIQALHFLTTARPHKGDMPPMLDVEPTSRQIIAMGGKSVLFREILAWMRTVERATGTKPVLYVGQEFVNKYLPYAPPKLSDYQVWIARYGQYKPYVHLLYWQLSADGRIRGIKGNVDVNVYNGTKESFKEYIRQYSVKR